MAGNPDGDGNLDGLSLYWSRRLSLTARILAVNIFPLVMLAGSFFYLDSYRERLVDERLDQASDQVWTLAQAMSHLPPAKREELLTEAGTRLNSRLRVYGGNGAKILDSFALGEPGYALRDPDTEPWRKDAARFLDRSIDWIVDAPDVADFKEPRVDQRSRWEEAEIAERSPMPVARFRYAGDRTPMISAAVRIPKSDAVAFLAYNARDVTAIVREERANLAIIIATVTIISVLLSLFLARTIVRPLRRIAHAAVKVRLGREREVVVPRLPNRRDEIGLLARSLSDMTNVLRKKIDATEAFAADVAHEIKNPLASLRSALEGLENVKDPELRQQLSEIAASDVRRLDRLITDIAYASRVDAQLTRAQFERVDLGGMIEKILAAREKRGSDKGREIAFARPRRGVATVMGEANRLESVLNNLLDNAVSFCPPEGLVEIVATQVLGRVIIRVIDEGPGVPEEVREEIFMRFHSARPSEEGFGEHSGLGLAIARTIIEGHDGTLVVRDREDGTSGACFEIDLPAAT